MVVEIVSGNLLNSHEQYILHQCNCVSNGAAGIARAIFDKYPYADVYATRKTPDVPGTIDVRGDGEDQRLVINMFAQFYPGGPSTEAHDTKNAREQYFRNCLLRVAELKANSIALPFGIGAGLAKGDWNVLLQLIHRFAYQHAYTKVVLYKLDPK